MKSNSDHTLRSKSEFSIKVYRSTNDSLYNYSSGLSERCDSENTDSCNIRPHPVTAQKILAIQKKISELLDEITFRLTRIPLPDGERDLRRRQQRVIEFAIRFSRNYLYDLGRQVTDLQRHLRAISPNARLKPTRRGMFLHVQAIEQKLTSAHQLLLHALSAYCKHIPSSVIKGHPGKLKEILQVVVDLNDICSQINLTTDYYGCGDAEQPPLGRDTKNRCNNILSQLRVCSDNESQFHNHTAQSSATALSISRSKKRNNKNNNQKTLARLSMYSSDAQFLKNQGGRKSAPTYTRDRRASSITQGIATHYHPSTPQQPNPSPITYRSLKQIVKRGKSIIRLPQTEDEISTMMSTLPTDSDAASSITTSTVSTRKNFSITRKNSSKSTSHKHPRNLNISIHEKLGVDNDELHGEKNIISQQQLSNLVPVIADLMTIVKNQRQNDASNQPVSSNSIETLMDFLRKCQSSSNPEGVSDETHQRTTKNSKHSRRRTIKSVDMRSGVKNMQLFCLSSGDNPQKPINSAEDVASNASDDIANHPQNFTRASSLVEKNLGITNFTVSKSSLQDLLKYRDEYQSVSRSNPMYTSNSQNKPWEVVAWIADKLIDELMVDVSKELEMEDVIRKLFELEFKEF